MVAVFPHLHFLPLKKKKHAFHGGGKKLKCTSSQLSSCLICISHLVPLPSGPLLSKPHTPCVGLKLGARDLQADQEVEAVNPYPFTFQPEASCALQTTVATPAFLITTLITHTLALTYKVQINCFLWKKTKTKENPHGPCH